MKKKERENKLGNVLPSAVVARVSHAVLKNGAWICRAAAPTLLIVSRWIFSFKMNKSLNLV